MVHNTELELTRQRRRNLELTLITRKPCVKTVDHQSARHTQLFCRCSVLMTVAGLSGLECCPLSFDALERYMIWQPRYPRPSPPRPPPPPPPLPRPRPHRHPRPPPPVPPPRAPDPTPPPSAPSAPLPPHAPARPAPRPPPPSRPVISVRIHARLHCA